MIGMARKDSPDGAGAPMGEDVLLQEIYEVNRLIHCNDVWFDAESDEDLIESCIYQRESLRARYRYLLAAARKRGISLSSFHTESEDAEE